MVMPSLVDAQLGLESEWIPHVTAGHSRQPLPAAGARCPQLVSDAPAARSWCLLSERISTELDRTSPLAAANHQHRPVPVACASNLHRRPSPEAASGLGAAILVGC